ncbi:MAG: hypothetical protein IPL40_00465 [Proteobacteria bacterium]|nr:hypothetical protein [Pseudomonadota bacterium]
MLGLVLASVGCGPLDTALVITVRPRPGVDTAETAALLVALEIPPGSTERTQTKLLPLAGSPVFVQREAGNAEALINIVANGRRGPAGVTVQAVDGQDRPLGVGADAQAGSLAVGGISERTLLLDAVHSIRRDVVLATDFALEATGRQVASAGDGRFVVVWETCQLSEPVACSVSARLYASGKFNEGRFVDIPSSSGSDEMPAVAMLPAGEFAVIWRRRASGLAPAIVAMAFDATGQELGGGAVTLSDPAATEVANPDLAVLPARDVASGPTYAAAWSQAVGSGASARHQIAVARLVPEGLTLRLEKLAAASQTAGDQSLIRPALAAGPDHFAVSWIKLNQGTADIEVRAYDSTGAPRGTEPLLLARSKQGLASGLDLAPLQAGGYLAIWHDIDEQGPDASGRGIHARRFSAAPAPLDDFEWIVNHEEADKEATEMDQFDPVLTSSGGRSLLALWTTQQRTQAAIRGLRQRRVSASGDAPVGAGVDLPLLDAQSATGAVDLQPPGAQRAAACALDDKRVIVTFLRPLPNNPSGREFELLARIVQGDGA